ncbi:MAG: sugar transferase, partial [Gemmatimonadota bacterium]|nr:sugar transferase [Gemmatimonadota bacterium]
LVRISSPGPIVFSQPRVGLCARAGKDRRGPSAARGANDRRSRDTGGQVFTIYKFRTMTVAEAKEEWATPENPRITSIGKFLRKTRIDELPQLFNVLLGDMNIVGPRPEQPGIFSTLRQEVDYYSDRQKVKPGITGLAQVSLGYDQSIDDVKKKVEKDLEYIARRTVWTDLKIMAKTVPVMLFRKGAI